MALIDRIKYDSPSDDAVVWKFPSKDVCMIIVRPSS